MSKQDDEQQRILIVDTDGDHADEIIAGYREAKASKEKPPVPIFVDTVRSTQSKLSDRDFGYAAVFVSPAIGTPAWMAVIRSAHQYRPGVPIFVLYDKRVALRKSEVDGAGVTGFVEKPMSYDGILKLLGTGGGEEIIQDLPTPLEENTPAVEAKPAESDTGGVGDDDVVEVELNNLAGRIKSPFAIFIRLSNGKFVRVLHAGDVLSGDRIQSYRERGAKALYVLKTEQSSFLDFCDSIVSEVLADSVVPAGVKTSQVLAQGESTLRLLRETGLSDRAVQRAQSFVANTTEMITQFAGQSALIRQLLTDIAAVEHSVACATLGGLLLKHLGGSNPAIFNGVGIACFLHDISLVGQPPEIRDEDPARMSPEQYQTFLNHPAESASLVEKIPKIPPSVVAAVAQHHMRRDGSGFPPLAEGQEINRLAELIGLSEEFLMLADKGREGHVGDPVEALKAIAEKKFSEPIVDAFVRAFSEK